MRPPTRLLALLPIVALGASLRFTGLDWGLRHVPHSDERVFVENVAAMLAAGDLDHRFYEYPGLFLYLLAPLLAWFGTSGPPAYLAARGLTAGCGTLSVLLVGLLGFRLGGTALGLGAALLLAVSPLEVVTAHMVRPDVALETCALLVFLALRGLGERPAADRRAGAALAAAISIKFTGVLLVPSYLLARVLAPGARLRGALQAAGVALLLGALFTPYAVLNFERFVRGADYQLAVHYKGQAPQADYADNLRTLFQAAGGALEPVAGALLLAGLWWALRDRRRWAPLLLYPVAILAVMASVDLLYVRHVLPCLGVLVLLAALPIHALAARHPWLAALLALAAAAGPARTSWNYVGNISGILPRDQVLTWLDSHLPAGALVIDNRPELGLGIDRRRFEVLVAEERRGPFDALLAEHADAIVTGPGLGRRWGGLRTLFPPPGQDAPLRVQAVAAERRARYERLELPAAHWEASQAPERAAAAGDGDPATVWTPGVVQAPGQWLAVHFSRPLNVARVELVLGSVRARYADDLRVWRAVSGQGWQRVPVVSLRGPIEEQPQDVRPASQDLLLAPQAQALAGLRFEVGSQGRVPWEVAELRVFARR